MRMRSDRGHTPVEFGVGSGADCELDRRQVELVSLRIMES